MISVVILTKNEEGNLPRCLASVAWSDNVVVVDSGSSDETVGIAEAAGADVLHRQFTDFASQRNFALESGVVRHDWVLHLDADEEVTEPLREAMHAVAKSPSGVDGYRVASRLMFMGRWLKHAGMYPCYQVRFGHRDRLRFKQVGHGQREDLNSDKVATLDGDLIHHNFSKGLTDWFTRHARYAEDEARSKYYCAPDQSSLRSGPLDVVERRRALKVIASKAPCRPLLRFVYNYFIRCGFLDGRAGLHYSMMMAVYEYMIVLNGLALKRAAKDGK